MVPRIRTLGGGGNVPSVMDRLHPAGNVRTLARMVMREALPGEVPAGGPEPTLEWVRPGGGVVGTMSARLGSDAAAEKVVLPVIAALRGSLAPDTWDGIVDELPFPLRRMLRAGPGGRSGASPGWSELVRAVSREAQHPPERTEYDVRAVFASMKTALPRGLVDAIAHELPADVAEAFRAAR